MKEDRCKFTLLCNVQCEMCNVQVHCAIYIVDIVHILHSMMSLSEDALDRSKMSQGLAGMQITGLQTSLRSSGSRHVDLFLGISIARA